MMEWALIENLQREDLNPIDRASAYRQFCDRFSQAPEQVAARLGEDRTTVVNYLRLLELPESVRGWVAEGRLSMGHARSLVGVANDDRRSLLAKAVIQEGLSVRALEDLIRRERAASPKEKASSREKNERFTSAHIRDLERRFEEALKTKVMIVEGKRKGSGRIMIEYFSLTDFDRIAEALGVREEGT
jgi:ParB family chromosome partitioning protein